jgi:hypothetical protein
MPSRPANPPLSTVEPADASPVEDAPGGANTADDWTDAGIFLSLEAEPSFSPKVADSDTASIATTLSTSAFEYRYEYGRRFHAWADNSYALPNDDEEASRLELQHAIWKKIFGGRLYLAPLGEDMTDAIDIGCGPGCT